MTNFLHAEANLHSTIHPFISRRTSISSILFSLGLALLGVVSIVLSLYFDISSSTLSMVLLTIGTILILVALYRFFWKSVELIYNPTGSIIREGSYYIDSVDLQKLQKMIEKKCLDESVVSFKQSGNGRMDYMVSKDGKFVAIQLFQFVPYTFEPFSDVYYYADADARAFQHFFKIQVK